MLSWGQPRLEKMALFSWSTPGSLLQASGPNSSAKEQAFTSKARKKQKRWLKSTAATTQIARAIMTICYLSPRQSARHCSSYHRQGLPRTWEMAQKEDTRWGNSLKTPFKTGVDRSDSASGLTPLSLVTLLHVVTDVTKQATYGKSSFWSRGLREISFFNGSLMALNLNCVKSSRRKFSSPFNTNTG